MSNSFTVTPQNTIVVAHFYLKMAEQHIELNDINIKALHSIFNGNSSYSNHAVRLIKRNFNNFFINGFIIDLKRLEYLTFLSV